MSVKSVTPLFEQAATLRHGQSVYAPPGERSRNQRAADVLDLLRFAERVAFAAGYAEGRGGGLIGEYTLREIDAALRTGVAA